MTEEARKLGKQAVVVFSRQDGMAYSLLSKREYFAGLAMQGMIDNCRGGSHDMFRIAKESVEFADALLVELVKNEIKCGDERQEILCNM